jgi:FKBP-type peptidyl-prolyl cis-trans isomerase SlyD
VTQPTDQRAENGKVVQIHYSLSTGGQPLESSRGGEPLTYLHGAQNIIPGLEKAIAGRGPGETLSVDVPPAEGYGERNRPERQEVPRVAFPPNVEIQAGMRFVTESDGEAVPVWVDEVTEDTVYIDFNHPLAGHTLRFDVEVLTVRDATQEEVTHGHPHGPGGHHHH